MPVEPLKSRALIRIKGEEAAHFLNNLVTCEIEQAAPGRALFGGLLSPQGKILFDFFIVQQEEGFLIDCPSQLRDELVKRLMFYRLRAKVEIEPLDMSVHAAWGENAPHPHGVLMGADSRHPEMGFRLYGWSGDEAPAGQQAETYLALRLRLGVPEGESDYAYGDAFPHEALFDQMGAVDFTKGCYVGQEVVSRMQHRSTARKRVIKVRAGQDLPETGTSVMAGDTLLGHLGSVDGTNGLAMLRLDKVSLAVDRGETITADGIALEASLPDWVTFGWPQKQQG